MKQERYSSFSHGIGQKVEDGSATLEEMEVCFQVYLPAFALLNLSSLLVYSCLCKLCHELIEHKKTISEANFR